jgi:hypothetical protein
MSAVICADGGAMHLAAGLGLPVVCLFGNSGAARWHPWGVPYRLLQKAPLDVADIAVDEVVAAFNSLRAIFRNPAPQACLDLGLVAPGFRQPCLEFREPGSIGQSPTTWRCAAWDAASAT